MEYDIKLVKVIKNELRDKMRSSDKNGKEITWYYFKDTNKCRACKSLFNYFYY